MNKNNYYVIFIIVISISIFFIVKEVKKKKIEKNKVEIENYFYNFSLLFDKIYSHANNELNCKVEENIIKNNIHKMENYLKEISKLGISDAEIIIMNKKECLKYKNNSQKIISNIEKNDFCSDIWRQINSDIGFLLEFRLIKTFINKNTTFLYKRYNCKSKDTQLIIGLSFKRM